LKTQRRNGFKCTLEKIVTNDAGAIEKATSPWQAMHNISLYNKEDGESKLRWLTTSREHILGEREAHMVGMLQVVETFYSKRKMKKKKQFFIDFMTQKTAKTAK